MTNYREHTFSEFSFLIDDFGFVGPMKKNIDDQEFVITYAKDSTKVIIRWKMYYSRTAPYPRFEVENEHIDTSFKTIMDEYSGCCFNSIHKYETLRDKWIFTDKKTIKRDRILDTIFEQRLKIFKRLLLENSEYLNA